MKLTANAGGDFTPHPETDGLVSGVIVDITPLKKVETQYGVKEKFRLVYETEVKRDDGTRYCVWSQGYTASLNEKASFRKDLKKILGRDLTTQELEEFDTESLLHRPVQLIVKHDDVDGKVYANIAHIQSDKSGAPLRPSGKYVRVQDREKSGDGTGEKAGYRKAEQDEGAGRDGWQRTKVHVGQNAGVDLGDLDEAAVRRLIDNWVPSLAKKDKLTADDKRLAEALKEAEKLLSAGANADF